VNVQRGAETVPTKTVLAFNPSHGSPLESKFWELFALRCASAGWTLCQVAARKIPSVGGAPTLVIPARMPDFDRWVGVDRSAGPSWLTEFDIDLQAEWEHRRWERHRYDPSITDALRKLASFVDRIVADVRPAVVLTTNRIDHPCAFGRRAAQHHGVPVIGMIERSPFESIWFEPDGLFSESMIWDEHAAWRSAECSDEHGSEVVDRLLAKPGGFRTNEVTTTVLETAHLPRPLVFFPMDNLLWTGWLPEGHPQGNTDYPLLRSPGKAIEVIASAVARSGGTLLVKAHPSCVETQRLVLPPNAHLIDASVESAVAAADVVAVFNSKVAFASVAAGVPTVTLANNPVAAERGMTYHWADYGSADAALLAALGEGRTPEPARVAHFFGRLDRAQFHSVPDSDDAPVPSTQGVRELFDDLLDRIDNHESLADSPVTDETLAVLARDARRPERRAAPSVRAQRGDILRVVLQATRLVDPQGRSSGIARYGRALLNGLEADRSVELYLLLREPSKGWTREAAANFNEVRSVFGDRAIVTSDGRLSEDLDARLGVLTERDVIHSIHLPLPPVAVTGQAVRVLTIHDVLHLTQPHFNPVSGTPTIRRVVESLVPSADFVLCDSDQTRRDLLSVANFPSERTRTVLLGVDPSCRCADGNVVDRMVPWGKFVVIMLQSEPRKNCDAALQCLAEVANENGFADLGVVLVGSQAAIASNHQLISRIPDDQYVTLPNLSDHELDHILGRATAFLYPSLYEGFGLPPLEAMAAGCPVIACANSSLMEVLQDSALYAHEGSVAELKASLKLLLDSDDLRRSFSLRGRRRANELSWERMTSQTVGVYQELVEHR
jgi:glycosyltransferase involved in cell wall biosynthesis